MTSCTYRFKNASGEEVTITGQAEMKAFLADGGLEQLLPGKVLPWSGKNSLQRDSSWVIKNKETGEIVMETFDRAKVDALNTSKYEAIPILQHLQSVNGKEKPQWAESPAESPKAKAKTGPATAQQAIDAFNADDSAAAMDVVARLKLEALNEVGAAIGFRPQIHENAKSYRARLAEVAEKLTKTGREEGKKKRALWDRMSLLASDWDRMERHTGTPEGSYDGKWMTHAQARPYLLAEIGSLQSSPYFAEIRPMVENARPSIFNALDSVEAGPATTAEPEPAKAGASLEGPRREPTKVSMFNPYQDGDVVTIGGQDWQVKQDMPGWYLTSTGNWRGTHPKIQRIRGMADLIREVEQAYQEAVPAPDQPAPQPAKAEEKPAKQSPAEASDKPFTLSDLDTLQSALRDGTATIEQYQSAWQAFRQNQDAIKAELTKKTKPQLLDMVGPMLAYRMKGDNKPEIVKAVFEAARNIFAMSREYGPKSFYMGEYKKYQEAVEKAFVELVEATTAEDLKAYADKVAEADTERRKALDEFEKAIEDPQTLDDFRKYVTAKLRQGMSESEVRMSLMPEQRARMDELHAEYARKSRTSRPAPAVTAASVTTGGDIVATKHTKTGEDLYVVRPAERVERDQYNIWNATAKRMGGWHSSFRGNGAVPGFQFKTRESADAFLAYVGGDTEGAKQVAQERRDAFADDRSQSAVERLTEMADRLEDRADESLSRDRKANTARRASMAASAEASANADKAMARTMRNIANAIKDGKAKFLDKVRQKAQVEMLRSFVSDAKYKHLTALYPNYVDFERNRHEPATAETADYATFPKYTADRADLARMGRELELIDGAKKLGQQLLKVADDVTDEYLKFVKENLNKVSTFRAGGGGPAIFSSRDDAERAIARSGFRGKAIVYAVKRGQNMVVMGPSMAKENGLWTADTSKRITLTDEAGEEITAKIESLNRNRERVYLPHQFSTTRERRAKLKAMGIETSAEFRAALREFIALSEAPSRPSKVKELERSMVGRKNDGLDFFPTPAGIAQQMIEAADIKEGMSVLEPSAGMGHIAEQIRESGVDPDVVEFSSSRRELLEAKGFNVVASDFMEASGEYDRIIMNPPFSDRRDAQHVQHAYGLLKPGGRLVAIMGEGVFFGQDKKATEFREWLDSVGGTSEKLPDGSFLDPSLPVSTGANARMVVIEKADDAPAVLRTDALPDTITVDGVDRPTTNSKGQPIHPTEEGVRNFWRWFGDSKVVDEQGRPLVVYHGTLADFSSPKINSRLGFFVTTVADYANSYADPTGYGNKKQIPPGNVMPLYAKVKNPLSFRQFVEFEANLKGRSVGEVRDAAIKAGFDGVDMDSGAISVFRPEQIKSAIGNTGAFDPSSPDIRLRTDTETDESAVSRDAAESFVRQFVEKYPSAPEIILADSFYQLPADVQRDAIAQGSGPFKAKGAIKNGKIYVLRRNHRSMADMEATVFHEVLGHAGIRKLLGPKFAQELNKLFIGLGGYSGLEKIMAARGMSAQFHGYMDGVRQAKERDPDLWTDALAATVMTEEVFAHIAEQKGGQALRDRFMALVGMVRDWLRNHGFAELASLGESDILFMLQRARTGMKESAGIVRNGVRIAGGEVLAENGQVISVEGDRDFDALKVLAGRLGLTVDDGPTVFSNSLPESQKSGDDARMDDANNVAGKQAPTPAGDVEAGGAEPRHTSRNWREWYELPRFQSDDDSTVLFNHGHGGYIQRVEDRKSGVFDGIFALREPGMTERGPDVTAFRIPDDKMLSQRDLEYSLDYDTVSAALADVFPKKLELGSADFDEVWKVIVEDNNQHEAIGVEEDGSIRDGSYMDIMGYSADDFADASWEAQNLRGRLAGKLGYQAVEMDDENGTSWYIVPGVESIPLNEPTPSDSPDGAPALLRTINTASGRKAVRDHVAEAFSNVTGESAKTFNWWQRTVGSQYGKAKSDKDFGRVYDAAHAFLDGVSAFAKEASERAAGILPHLDTWRDVAAGANVRKQWADSQDYQAIAPAIFDGTLANGTTGKVWTDDQLRDKYDLNDKQIGHYREFRAAVDFSLETLAASEMARLARASKMDVADRDMGMPDALAFYTDQLQGKIDAVQQAREEMDLRHSVERENMADLLSNVPNEKTRTESMRVMDERQAEESAKLDKATKQLEDLMGSFSDKARQIRKLQSEGYAPLMRFGRYTVDVVKLDDEGQPMQDEDGNPDRPFFGMFESEAEARKAEKILAEEYPGYTVTRGVLSTEANQLYRGLTPETAEMFARLLGTDENEAFQAYLKQAVANRSAMKRLINRMGVEGFATDVPRVLSAFITSNARLSSGNWYFGEMSKAVEAIPKHKGDVKTEAVRLMQYVQNPVEEAAGLRGFLFFSFLGGSIASALVNLTQTFTTTLPYLSQFGAGDVAKALPKAMALSGKMMKKGIDAVSDKDLKDALRKASDEGVVDPQEIHLLMAEAGGNGASVGFSGLAGAMNKEWATPAARVTRSLSQAWGMLFGAAEKYNRHVAFIAAWEVAPKGVDRYEFAKNAVTETQFDYTKASRPNWARGAVGATLFTFKTFSINYVEFMSRLPPRERAIALGVLFLLAGMSGMPGGDDLDDVVDTVAQKMGYNWNNAAARHAWLVRVIGVGGADFVERGISSMLPLDVSARLGMGNLIPGTAVLQKSNASPSRDVQEFFGPAGSVVAGFREVFDNAGGGKGVIESGLPLLPKMYRDVWQALDMVQTGQYRDTKGRKVVDVDGVDALLKGIGFQPNAVAEPRRIERMLAQSSGMQRIIRKDISELWARGVAEQDAQKIESARSILREWNEKNPDSRIVMNPTSIAQRVRAMRLTSAERLVKATPKDMRNALAAEMAIQQ